MGLRDYVGNGQGAWIRFVLQVAVLPVLIIVMLNWANIRQINSSRWTDKDQHAHEQKHANWEREVLMLMNGKADKDGVPPESVKIQLAAHDAAIGELRDLVRDEIRELRRLLEDIRKEIR